MVPCLCRSLQVLLWSIVATAWLSLQPQHCCSQLSQHLTVPELCGFVPAIGHRLLVLGATPLQLRTQDSSRSLNLLTTASCCRS